MFVLSDLSLAEGGYVLQAFEEHLHWRSAFHHAALVGALMVVVVPVGVEVHLHLFDALVPCRAAFHAEVLIEQGAVETLDEAIALRTADLGWAVLNSLQLQE